MKPGRKHIPRAERLRLGLPVCIVEGCHRAPNTRESKRCRRHGSEMQRGAQDVVSSHLFVQLPAAVHAAAKARAADERMTLALWVTGALTRALETPQRGAGSPGGGG